MPANRGDKKPGKKEHSQPKITILSYEYFKKASKTYQNANLSPANKVFPLTFSTVFCGVSASLPFPARGHYIQNYKQPVIHGRAQLSSNTRPERTRQSQLPLPPPFSVLTYSLLLIARIDFLINIVNSYCSESYRPFCFLHR